MSMCRRFHGEPVSRLIVSVPVSAVRRIDEALKNRQHPARGNRAEFVRLAIADKLQRAGEADLMISMTLDARVGARAGGPYEKTA